MKHTRLRIVELDGNEIFDTGSDELIVLPLSGSCSVTIDGERFELEGRGYHGPSMAAPGYDLYYLNVMAGEVRERNFVDVPEHAWIRASWADQELDPRLPMTAARRHA